jgi:hypothetical protein
MKKRERDEMIALLKTDTQYINDDITRVCGNKYLVGKIHEMQGTILKNETNLNAYDCMPVNCDKQLIRAASTMLEAYRNIAQAALYGMFMANKIIVSVERKDTNGTAG